MARLFTAERRGEGQRAAHAAYATSPPIVLDRHSTPRPREPSAAFVLGFKGRRRPDAARTPARHSASHPPRPPSVGAVARCGRRHGHTRAAHRRPCADTRTRRNASPARRRLRAAASHIAGRTGVPSTSAARCVLVHSFTVAVEVVCNTRAHQQAPARPSICYEATRESSHPPDKRRHEEGWASINCVPTAERQSEALASRKWRRRRACRGTTSG